MTMASKVTCLSRFPQIASGGGTGVVCEIWALEVAVIPVPPWRSCELIPAKAKAFRAEAQSRREHKENKAVIYFESLRLRASSIIFSQLRRDGNDRRFVRDAIPNDTTTPMGGRWQILGPAPNCERSASK